MKEQGDAQPCQLVTLSFALAGRAYGSMFCTLQNNTSSDHVDKHCPPENRNPIQFG